MPNPELPVGPTGLQCEAWICRGENAVMHDKEKPASSRLNANNVSAMWES
jgi:hypothetical protein